MLTIVALFVIPATAAFFFQLFAYAHYKKNSARPAFPKLEDCDALFIA